MLIKFAKNIFHSSYFWECATKWNGKEIRMRKIHTSHQHRCPAPVSRFYEKTNILYNDGFYEIILDQKKLKTRAGNILQIQDQALALAIALEWDSQKDKIQPSSMHLTGLASTVIDNPNKLTKSDIIQSTLNFFDTDTILYHNKDQKDLYEIQQNEWGPIIKWFNDRFHVSVRPSISLTGPAIDALDVELLKKHLNSYDLSSLFGFLYATDTLKSLLLTLCCVERNITTERAVLLSRLEEEFQLGYWGRVEWAHDINQLDLQSRISAAVLFIHLNANEEQIPLKKDSNTN